MMYATRDGEWYYYLVKFLAEFHDFVGPTIYGLIQAALYGLAGLYLLFTFFPHTYRFGQLRATRYFHAPRLIRSVVLGGLAYGMSLVQPASLYF